MRNYKIYVHINKSNKKMYIGQTGQEIEKRFAKDGAGYKNCKYFSKAIQKYGWNNFEHIILMDNLTKSEADIIEEALIKKYNTTSECYGYNTKIGNYNIVNTVHKKNTSKNNTSDKIRKILEIRNITQVGLSQKLGIEQPTLSKKIKMDNWRESDLQEIASACDCQFENFFILDNGEKI
ncbi:MULTISPECIES: GIY-YIG nuclease family protein [unclassified Lactonifactor]|uniref:GIY-YIG nuclease family protein n=1 Tax=unclassified Lactonifactor TaxID=2636670 RepID=UPI0015636D51|nr:MULTISPECIES: GIY-YIG nuclease family protein [unclassified Lactonifactor]